MNKKFSVNVVEAVENGMSHFYVYGGQEDAIKCMHAFIDKGWKQVTNERAVASKGRFVAAWEM